MVYDELMKRFQMMMDRELDEALGREARREGVSKAELLRRYAREKLAPLPRIEDDPLWGMVGLYDGEVGEYDIDEVVYGGKTRDRP